jgi:tetratricopeptide (TPR) repeat protein
MHFTMNHSRIPRSWPCTAPVAIVVSLVMLSATIWTHAALADESASGASGQSVPRVLAAEPSHSASSATTTKRAPTTLLVVPDDSPKDAKRIDPHPTAAARLRPKVEAAAPREQPKPAAPSGQTPLEPIPDAKLAGPVQVETAAFNGVTPGVSTVAELEKAWGAPKETRQHEGVTIRRYVIAPFERIEVALSGDKVGSVVIRLEKAFPAQAVAEQLQLGNIRPVLISNELGDILGQAFPERGVLFAFEQTHEPGKPSMNVTEIVLEPVSADSFILRAETNLENNYAMNLRDLDEAIKLSPNVARAHWLRARVLAGMGKPAEALVSAAQAAKLERDNARYFITLAQILEQTGRHDEAIAATKAAIELSGDRPHVKARALCLLGDLVGGGAHPDYAAALTHHTEAIKTADPLAVDRHPAIRLAAKEVLIDAHLGAATDIAWGDWAEKEKAVLRWAQRAAAFAEELIANDGGTSEHRFRVATRTLAAYVGTNGKLDPTDWAKETARVGKELIDKTEDPIQKQQLESELGMALFNAVQMYQARKDNESALQYGQQTVAYLEAARKGQQPNLAQDYVLGRLYFRLGAIHALSAKNHREAIAMFDKAIPLLESPAPNESVAELGRHGETFVSMGVSYWELGQQDKAMQLTQKGLELMKKSVEGQGMKKSALTVPYENLAAMQRHLGKKETAAEFQKLADDARGPKSVQNPGTANKPGTSLQR